MNEKPPKQKLVKVITYFWGQKQKVRSITISFTKLTGENKQTKQK